MTTDPIRAEQDLKFYQSLYEDMMKSLKRTRAQQRLDIQNLLESKLPDILKDLLPVDDHRLLRLSPIYLTEDEKARVREIKNKLEGWRMGACYNMTPEDELTLERRGHLYKLVIPNFPLTICIDILDVLTNGMLSESLNLADVMINLPNGERYRYPLNDDELENFMGTIYLSGQNPGSYPQMQFPEIQNVLSNILLARRQLGQLT